MGEDGWLEGARVWVREYRRVLEDGLVSATLGLFVFDETRGVDGGGEEERKEANAESNDERRNKIESRLKYQFFIFLNAHTPIDRIISHPNKPFDWLLPSDVKQLRVASSPRPRKVLVRVARLQLRPAPVAKMLLALGAGHLPVTVLSATRAQRCRSSYVITSHRLLHVNMATRA
jgi:hypothetical protein